jgi:2'-5' RNA ligase
MADSTHRMFIGCPIPGEPAAYLHEWVERDLLREGVRSVPPENMHVTFMFYANASPAVRESLIDLIRQVDWTPITCVTGELEFYGKSAIALDLESSGSEFEILADRLIRTSFYQTAEKSLDEHFAYHDRLKEEPLGQMAKLQSGVEWAKKSRWQRHYVPEFHLTVARLKHQTTKFDLPIPPQIEFSLDRICLYESFLDPTGSRYEIVGEGREIAAAGSDPALDRNEVT